ncbi:MAG: hypothetical protein K0Q72_1100 [Armatimonadetes bacterium]|nr:hypothetical protein [Armatimonadota bacterium]
MPPLTTASESKPKPAARTGHRPPRPLHLRINSLLRWLHTYLSMVGLMVVLLFSVTGITLNHPEWTFGAVQKRTDVKGEVPREWVAAGPEVKKLEVAEYLRKQHHFRGSVSEFRVDERECSLSFKAPGYAADGFLDRETGAYTFAVSAEGVVAVINDLHRGRNSGRPWALAIDVSAVMLILVSLTGVGMLLYLKRTRTSALWSGFAGLVVLAVLIYYAV